MDNQLKKIVYGHNTIEFVTVAVQYCVYVENIVEESKNDLVDKMTKLLPLLYLKTAMLLPIESIDDDEPQITVQEDDYNYILSKLQQIIGADDTFLEVFLDDMKYSDTPIAASVSEDLTDIYQDLKNCITIYERGIDENMNDALYICIENFKSYWGQKLVNVLRALHMIKYSNNDTLLDEEPEDEPIDDIW